jgi:ribosome-binding protein aMBF1 (putative translation factor)
MSSIAANIILNGEAANFAVFLNAYHECSDEIRAVVDEMARIIGNRESTAEDREEAAATLIEALFPGVTGGTCERFAQNMRTHGCEIRSELDAEEETFAHRLRHAMEVKGFSQQQLAALIGVSQPAISNLLNRTCRPQRGTVEKLAHALGIKPDELWPALEPQLAAATGTT